MEGWGKGLDKPSVLCLSEFILNFEEDCDFLFLSWGWNHFVSRHWKRNVIMCFSFSIVLFLLLFIILMSSFKKFFFFLQNKCWILFQNDPWRKHPWLFGTTQGCNIDLTSPSHGVWSKNCEHKTCPASLRRALWIIVFLNAPWNAACVECLIFQHVKNVTLWP